MSVLLDAAAREKDFSPPLEHAAWALIRLGRELEAEDAMARFNAAAAPAAQGYPGGQPALIRLAFALRFGTADERKNATQSLLQLLPELPDTMRVFVARVGLSVGLPETEQALGEAVFRARGEPARVRGSGALAQALAMLAMGRARPALTWLDSAGVLLGSEGQLQAAQWRLIPGAIGWEIMPAPEVEVARQRLEGEWDDAQAPRAYWTLALDALARGDATDVARWKSRLREAANRPSRTASDDASSHAALVTLIEAGEAATRSEWAKAILLTDPLKELALVRPAVDPFLRAVLYLNRGLWYERLGDLDAADREWLWSENNDIGGWLFGPAERAEIDWVFDAYSAYLRSRAALRADEGNTQRACSHLERVEHFWRTAEPASGRLLRSARRSCNP